MDKVQLGQHISQQFNEELEDVRNRVLAMGGMVEQQLSTALQALINGDSDLATNVISGDVRVNAMEVEIDEECSRILARRQPAASDLRLLVAIIKTITDLERMGDQAERVAKIAVNLAGAKEHFNQYNELENLGNHVLKMVRDALDTFARMDAEEAVRVAHEDLRIDREYESLMRQLITFMMEDPRTITRSLDMIWAARALERIGDHARNICEYVIYLVKGKDVRHISLEQLEEELGGSKG